MIDVRAHVLAFCESVVPSVLGEEAFALVTSDSDFTSLALTGWPSLPMSTL